MRSLLIFVCLLSLCSTLSRASGIASPLILQNESTPNLQIQGPSLIAGITSWLDDLLGGARKVPMPSQNVRNQSAHAYRYTQNEDRRGNERGILYYLCMGIWRLGAGGTAGFIVSKALSKKRATDRVLLVGFVTPLVVGLLYPLFALFAAWIIWMGSGERSSET